MGFPRKLLNTGEELVLDLRPHWSFFAGPAALLVAALVVLVVVAVADVGDWALLAAAGVVLAALLWFAGRYLRWGSTNFALTTDRLIYRSGLIAKRGMEMPLERVNTVFSNQTMLERLLRCGDLTVESGGERGQQTFTDIPNPSAVQNEIYKQIEDNHGRMYGVRSEPDVVDQLDRLDELRRRGVITDAEFAAKKAKLLDHL